MNELMKIEPPNGNAEVAQMMHDYVVNRERELREEFDAIAAKLTPESFGETKSEWTRLKKIDAELKTIIEGVEAKALEFAKADALLTQLTATRKNLASVYKENWAKYVELRDADKPAPESFEYVIEMRMPDTDFTKLAAKWTKDGIEFRARRVKDNESAKIGKLFEEASK